VAQAQIPHGADKFGGGLGRAVVDGVAAADIGNQGMDDAGSITQVQAMSLAGAAAGAVIGATSQRMRKYAVLGMEHGHVLVDHRLEGGGAETPHHRTKLIPIEIIAGNETLQAVGGDDLGGDFVGDVQGVIANKLEVRSIAAEIGDRAQVANQNRVRLADGKLAQQT